MKNSNNLILLLVTGLLAFACTSQQGNNQEAAAEKTEVSEKAVAGITLTKAPASPEYPEAMLTKNDLSIKQTDTLYTLNYGFDVQNYALGVQTSDAAVRGIANSEKGQHIHYIVNNGPYAAHYMSDISDQLEAGNYVVLAFLSRSYHESVKSEGAYYIENITVGDVTPSGADLTAPHLFYSRPKGTYTGADTAKVMLDFYLLNEAI
ncbi:MAG: phosphopeptide-binding protein, partial [Ekhidna sp.]|nr:phosphopeptide-binding protein [Ekhidna sp.]